MASHLDVKVGAADNGGEAKGRDHQHLITVWLSTCAIARCLLGNQGLVLRLNTAHSISKSICVCQLMLMVFCLKRVFWSGVRY